MFKYIFILTLTFFTAEVCHAQKEAKLPVQKVLKLAEAQLQGYLSKYPDTTKYARNTNADGSLRTVNASDWTSGFFPGELWFIYRFTNNPYWKKQAMAFTAGIESQQNNTGTHDLGFMMYNSIGQAYHLTGSAHHKQVLLQGAKSLATRFNANVGAIKSWDNPKFNYPVIVDNLMNLEYLFWATRVSGDSSFYKIAVKHANTDMQYRFRINNSTYHVLDFDKETGKLLAKRTHQGNADESCWARGQAWAIYGYTNLYRETKDKRYLKQAMKAANYFISQTNKIADHIPYWDFNAPDIPTAPRDASAAAVAASGMLELSHYAGAKNVYKQKAVQMLKNLCSPQYLAKTGTNNYFLLKHSTGHKPAGTEINVPIVYADYYLLEALWRYQNYSNMKKWF
ncbi:glycoside hydrolase family 88 protein [Mucilaginibacter terrae]|uniref:glycoside hydrolase family 88 protein n=1 Tax=Mucilaginibacter terrae TaxID=1955052 RepID=UPI00362C18DB